MLSASRWKGVVGSSRVCIFTSGFVSHQAVARTAGNILIRLADSLVLPLNCSDYAESLEDYLTTAVTLYEPQLQMWNISMGNRLTHAIIRHDARKEYLKRKPNSCSFFVEPLKSAVANFRKAATHMDQMIHSSDLANET